MANYQIDDKELSNREKIAIRLILFLIQMIKPYEYEHQFKAYFDDIRKMIGAKDD